MSKRGVFSNFSEGGYDASRGQCPRGGACECPRVGAFFKLMTSRGQCPRGGGGAPGVPPIQVQTPPTWLAGYGPVIVMSRLLVYRITWYKFVPVILIVHL